jgi:hypothetical protein
MKIELTGNYKHYTAEGRVVLLSHQLPDKTYTGVVTKTHTTGEITTMLWLPDGQCIQNSKYNIIPTVNYHQLAKLTNTTYDLIRTAYTSGKLNIQPAFTKYREVIFHEQDVLNMLNNFDKKELRNLIVQASKESSRAKYERRKISKKLHEMHYANMLTTLNKG